MTETIWYGQDNIVRFTALATNYTDFTGASTGDPLPGVILVYSENRSTGWVDQVIENPVCLWQAENVAIWEAEIPSGYITLQTGNGTLQVSGTGMRMVTIPLTIGTSGGTSAGGATAQEIWEYTTRTITGGTSTGGGNEQVLNAADYTFDAVGKTITLNGDYATLELPQILRIKNVTKGLMVIYDCNDPDTAISYTAPIIFYTRNFAYKGTAFANGDELQITVNKKS